MNSAYLNPPCVRIKCRVALFTLVLSPVASAILLSERLRAIPGMLEPAWLFEV